MEENYIMPSKIFYHYDRVKAYLNDELVKPIAVKVRLTDRCNLDCDYCSYKNKLSNNDMREEDVILIFDNLMKMGVKAIVLTGGEPTCYPDFKKVVKYAKEVCGLDVALVTNGVIYPDALEYLTWVRFSLDIISKSIYKKIKGANKLLEVQLNIDKAIKEKYNKDYDITIGIQMLILEDNYREMIDIIEYATLVGADYCQIRPLENFEYDEEFLRKVRKKLKEIKERDFGIKVITTDYKWEELNGDYYKSYEKCPGADFIGMVDIKGDFYICCAMTNDKMARYGSLITDNVNDILEKRKEIQANFDYKKCTVACQASLLNKTLINFKNIEHVNFI